MQTLVWRKIPILRNLLPPSIKSGMFHSTPISFAKGKNKDYIRYAVRQKRQKRADTKKAIKDLFVYGKSSKYFQDDGFNWTGENNHQNARTKNQRSGSSKLGSASSSGKGKHKGWHRKQQFYDLEDDEIPGNFFNATFGGQKCYTWSFTWTENFSFNGSTGFGLGGESKWEKGQRREWSESDVDEDESTHVYESAHVGSRSHRITLGLPPTGPLKLDEVKCAFRASALKWHPDKHQGPSQAIAEEKFKLCVNAYNSLCTALKSA